MTPMNYSYSVQGQWIGPANERPAVTGAKFLKTLDSLSSIDALFSGWRVIRNWKIVEDERPRCVSLETARKRIAEIVESGVSRDEYGEATPGYGYTACATAGARGSRRVTFTTRTGNQNFLLSFGEYDLASDLTIVTYPRFKAALLAISGAWDAQWSYARAYRNDPVMVPIDFGPGVPAFRVDTALQVPLDPTFPRSIFHVPWIGYLSAQRATGLKPSPEIVTERTADGGLLMTATEDLLNPANPEHARRARILAEIMIAHTENRSAREQ